MSAGLSVENQKQYLVLHMSQVAGERRSLTIYQRYSGSCATRASYTVRYGGHVELGNYKSFCDAESAVRSVQVGVLLGGLGLVDAESVKEPTELEASAKAEPEQGTVKTAEVKTSMELEEYQNITKGDSIMLGDMMECSSILFTAHGFEQISIGDVSKELTAKGNADDLDVMMGTMFEFDMVLQDYEYEDGCEMEDEERDGSKNINSGITSSDDIVGQACAAVMGVSLGLDLMNAQAELLELLA